MLVTLLGIVTEVRPLQPENDFSPILVTLPGILIEATFVFPSKKCEGITSTSFPIVTVFIETGNWQEATFMTLYLRSTKLSQLENAPGPILVTLLGIMIEVRPLHLQNAKSSILVTLLGIVTEVSPQQSLNAPKPILVTLLGIVIEVKLTHPLNA